MSIFYVIFIAASENLASNYSPSFPLSVKSGLSWDHELIT